MSKKIKTIFILILCLGLNACSNQNASSAEKNFTSGIAPDIIDCGGAGMVGDSPIYYYTIDRNTGVVYLSFDAYRRHAITVMLNPDGTPITADQLGIPVK